MADSIKSIQMPATPSSRISSPRHFATADAHELTGDEKLSRARALREMGEKFDDVIRQFVAAPDDEKPPRREWALAEPFYPRTPESEQQRRDKWALAEPFYPRKQNPQKQRPADPRLDGLREHFQLSPRFYDTCDRCVSVGEFGRVQHDLVAEYHRRPQLWMSPHLLTDIRKKMAKKVKVTKWYDK